MLNRLGFCHTYNVKGTQVTLFNDQATFQSMKNRIHKRIPFCISAASSSWPWHPLRRPCWRCLTSAEMNRPYGGGATRPYAVPLSILMHHIIENLPLEPYQIILRQVSGILRWGYYYSFYQDGIRAGNELNQISHEAFRRLQAGRYRGICPSVVPVLLPCAGAGARFHGCGRAFGGSSACVSLSRWIKVKPCWTKPEEFAIVDKRF